mgnify:CR=1 FL=1
MTLRDHPGSTEVSLSGRTLRSAEDIGLGRGVLGSWGVFAQGLAAAAPSVAVAVVPFSLFVAAGKGAAWAVLVGLAIAALFLHSAGQIIREAWIEWRASAPEPQQCPQPLLGITEPTATPVQFEPAKSCCAGEAQTAKKDTCCEQPRAASTPVKGCCSPKQQD